MKKTGYQVLQDPRLNKGTAFTLEEREKFGLIGLLPPRVSTLEKQVARSLMNIRRQTNDIDKYIFLSAMQSRNERLFYRLLIDHIDELMPIVYTPTVGLACQEFSNIFRETSGCYISIADRGGIRHIMDNWPTDDVRLIVVTDGERILGLGDLGASGMGIPIGKLALYCACAGVHPEHCLPILIDVGTNNTHFRDDPLYLGLHQERVRGEEYLTFVDEFVNALIDRFPNALLQFEDFATPNAVALLQRNQHKLLCFNDDIQGTASVALAGLYAATRVTNRPLKETRFMFVGAGSAATGIGNLLIEALKREGLDEKQAQQKLLYIDDQGLLTTTRDLPPHAKSFAADAPNMSFLEAIHHFRPHALIGATGVGGLFTQNIIEAISKYSDIPIIFALSNPTANAECTAEEAYRWSDGRAVFASGSPFSVVHIHGEIKVPGQGNNAYIFPGLGLGSLSAGVLRITDELLITAAQTLAGCVSENQIDQGCLYPPLNEIRHVSLNIAVAVAKKAEEIGLTSKPLVQNYEEKLKKELYDPHY